MTEEVTTRRGPKELAEGERKELLRSYIPGKILKKIGYNRARAIAEKAVSKEYFKIIK